MLAEKCCQILGRGATSSQHTPHIQGTTVDDRRTRHGHNGGLNGEGRVADGGSGVLVFWGSEVKRRQRRQRRPECATENRSEHLITCGSRGRSQVIALKSTARDVCKANHRNFIYDAAILWLRLCHTCLRHSEVPVFVRWVMGDGRWVVAGKMDEKRHVAHVS